MTKLVDRFLKYVKFDTQSDELTNLTPSTPGQMVFAKELERELHAMGLSDISLDDNGYLFATLPANTDKPVPTVGFIAHMDTAPDMSGHDVKPRIVKYEGEPIVLSEEPRIVLDPVQFPEMNDYKGQEFIVTSGDTLLGADDKAGIAEILSAVEWLQEHPEVKHGNIRVGFNPDEEIGLGAHHFDVEKFGCDWAYTMDGGAVGELEFENFNAASAKIHVQGCNVHPGYAKGKMKNAILIGQEFQSMLPALARPEHTEGYEGFFHLISFKGSVEEADFAYIIRDHDRARFEARKEMMAKVAGFINEKYGKGTVDLVVKDQYYNMREQVEPHYHIIDKAVKAMEMAGVKPKIQPIRGGTDGANLSFKGLPCPNLFAGGLNFHGKMEFVPVESMEKAAQVILNLVGLYAE